MRKAYSLFSLKIPNLFFYINRMVKIIKKLGPSLSFLEEVRKHLARMPSIDPYTRTILITGFPNVGKSSFMN